MYMYSLNTIQKDMIDRFKLSIVFFAPCEAIESALVAGIFT